MTSDIDAIIASARIVTQEEAALDGVELVTSLLSNLSTEHQPLSTDFRSTSAEATCLRICARQPSTGSEAHFPQRSSQT